MKLLERCPECNLVLSPMPLASGSAAACRGCAGVCVGIDVLRQHAPESVVQELWTAAQDRGRETTRGCPACERPMRTFDALEGEQRLELDVCTSCLLLWFDGQELDRVGLKLAPPSERPAEARNAKQESAAELAKLLMADVWYMRRRF